VLTFNIGLNYVREWSFLKLETQMVEQGNLIPNGVIYNEKPNWVSVLRLSFEKPYVVSIDFESIFTNNGLLSEGKLQSVGFMLSLIWSSYEHRSDEDKAVWGFSRKYECQHETQFSDQIVNVFCFKFTKLLVLHNFKSTLVISLTALRDKWMLDNISFNSSPLLMSRKWMTIWFGLKTNNKTFYFNATM